MKLPNGPWMPAFLLQQRFGYLQALEAAQKRYGDPFTIKMQGMPPMIMFSHPDLMREVFTADPTLFEHGKATFDARLLGNNSLFMLEGNRHIQQRRLLMPPFHGERMQSYGQLICAITKKFIHRCTIDQSISVYNWIREITLEIILQVVFGISEGEQLCIFQHELEVLSDLYESSRRDGRLFQQQRQRVDTLIYSEIERRRQQHEIKADVLSLLMAARDEAGEAMTNEELRDELMTLLFAGHETVTAAVAWAIYAIHRTPEVYEKIMQELSHLPLDADPLSLVQQPYLTAVCKETLRLYPIAVITFSRALKGPLEILGYEFPPNTILQPCIYLTHQREDLYPEPKRFRPERFLERQFSPYEFLPFGGGSRRCVGMAFAQFEMKLILATLLKHVQFTLADSRPLKPVGRGIVMAPPDRLRITVRGLMKSDYRREDCMITCA